MCEATHNAEAASEAVLDYSHGGPHEAIWVRGDARCDPVRVAPATHQR